MTPRTIASVICAVVLFAVPMPAADDQTAATMPIPTGATVFIENTEFGQALSAAIFKKKVPVVVVTDREKADYFITEISQASKEGTAERVTKVLVFGMFAGSGKTFEASVNCTNRDGIVVFERNTSKPSIKNAAEDIASKLRDHIKQH